MSIDAVSIAERAGLSLTSLQTSEDRVSHGVAPKEVILIK